MKQRMISLRLKLVLAIVFLVLVLSTIIVCVSYFTYRNAMNEHYETLGNNVARTAIALMDEEQMRAFKEDVFDGEESVMQTQEYQDVLCGNFGSFTGRKMSIPEFLERYPGGTVDVMDEMYGYNQAWISGFLNYGSKCYEIQLEFYYAGDFCYLLRE